LAAPVRSAAVNPSASAEQAAGVAAPKLIYAKPGASVRFTKQRNHPGFWTVSVNITVTSVLMLLSA
jgi:hypothetical protein